MGNGGRCGCAAVSREVLPQVTIPEKWTEEHPCFAITTGVRLRSHTNKHWELYRQRLEKCNLLMRGLKCKTCAKYIRIEKSMHVWFSSVSSICTTIKYWRGVSAQLSRQTHFAILTSLLRQNDVILTYLRRYYYVMCSMRWSKQFEWCGEVMLSKPDSCAAMDIWRRNKSYARIHQVNMDLNNLNMDFRIHVLIMMMEYHIWSWTFVIQAGNTQFKYG